MKKIVILVLLAAAAVIVWKKKAGHEPELKPLYPEPYIAVYGQDSDSWTQNYIRRLNGAGIKCIYKNLDQPEVGEELYPRIHEAKLGATALLLPVVDVNGSILVRPRIEKIFTIYNKKANGKGVVWQKDAEASGNLNVKPYVVVYGRDSCGWTKKSLEDLRDAGIKYTYKKIDQFEVEEELYWRMKDAGLDTTSYNLPVIDVNGKVFTRTKIEEIISLYKTAGE